MTESTVSTAVSSSKTAQKASKSGNRYSQLTGPNHFNAWRALCHAIVSSSTWLHAFYKYKKIHVLGREHIPPRAQGSIIIACKHESNEDIPLLSFTLRGRNVAYMAKQELFEVPILGPLLYECGVFAVNREKLEIATIRMAKAAIETNRWDLALFPEGTRSARGEMGEVKKGATTLAKMFKRPVLPVGLRRHGNSEVTVRVGELIPLPESLDEASMDAMHVQLVEAITELSSPID